MSNTELYDPEFPCDSDLLDGSDATANEDMDGSTANAVHVDYSQLQLSSIELPPEPYKPELVQTAESRNSSEKELSSSNCVKATDSPKKSDSSVAAENSFNTAEDTDGDDAIEDDARYRDELKKLSSARQTKDLESKAAKDVPLEMYLGPSVGFRVDLNKTRKSNVESIAKRRHNDLFERLSPEQRGKSKSNPKSGEIQSSSSKTDFKSLSNTTVKLDIPGDSSGEVSRQKKSGHNERSTLVESGEESDKDLRSLLRKREAENQELLAVPRVLKMKQTDAKVEEKLVDRSDETPSSRRSKPRENDRNDIELLSRKKTNYGSEPRKSKHRRHELEVESNHQADREDNSASRRSDYRDREKGSREKESKPSNLGRHGRDEYEPRHRSKERSRGKNEDKEMLNSTSKGRGKDRERQSESDTDADRNRAHRKRRSSRSTSKERTKKQRKSKSRSPKRKRDRSKSGDHRQNKDGHSRSRERERRHEKRPETKTRNDDRHVTPVRHRKDDQHRHHRSRSKTPIREPELKKVVHLRHSDFKESSCYEAQWAFEEKGPSSDRHKSKQPSLRELQEKSTSLLEACMKTRYENRGSGDDRRRSHLHRHHNDRDFVQSHSFGRTSGKPGSVDYITLSDSDEGIVWSDNDEGYGDYSCLPARSELSKKQKYEDIYSSRSLQSVENCIPSRTPPKPPNNRSQKESSLSPSEIIAINLKRKENSKKMKKLKITKSVSPSSLEPGEIDESSADLSDNGLIEDLEPVRRTVSLVNEDEANRRPGDKVPIQIHVITSHGDGRGSKVDEFVSKDCEENVTSYVTTTGETESTAVYPERCDNKTDAQSGMEEEMRLDEQDSDDKEMTDLMICTDNSPLDGSAGNGELPYRAEQDGLGSIFDTQNNPPIEEEFLKNNAEGKNSDHQEMTEVMFHMNPTASDVKFKDIFDVGAMKDDISGSSTKNESIPGLGDAFPSPIKEPELELTPVGTRNASSFYHIKKKTHPEQTSLKLDLNSDPTAPKPLAPHLLSPHKTLLPKEDLVKAAKCSSPPKNPNPEPLGAASLQIPSTLSPSLPSLLKSTVPCCKADEDLSTVDAEPLQPLSSDRQSNKVGIPKPTSTTNTYLLNQNTAVDLLGSYTGTTVPSSSSALVQQPVTAPGVASHEENPISKLLAAFNPMLATLGNTSATTSQSQKLIEELIKSTAAVPGSSLQHSVESKSGSATDIRLTNIFDLQKKLLELTRISATASQPAAPISQKLVQDIFKAVLVPASSAKSSGEVSSLCPRAPELPASLSEENSLSPTSPFDVDAASPLSGEIMSFSPPSLPDINSPAKKPEQTPKQAKPSQESKGSTQKTKSKDAKPTKSKPEEVVKDKKSKAEIQKLVVEEVKSIIRPFYSKGRINKDEYKEIMRKTVPSICHSKTQDFSKTRITIYVEAYVRKVLATRKYNAKKKDK